MRRLLAAGWLALVASAPAAGGPLQLGDAVTVRTAGQPERHLRVVWLPLTPDGLADVEDVATGARYSLPLKVVSGWPRAAAGAVKPPAPKPSSASTLDRPPVQPNGWPVAATRPPASRPAPARSTPAVPTWATGLPPTTGRPRPAGAAASPVPRPVPPPPVQPKPEPIPLAVAPPPTPVPPPTQVVPPTPVPPPTPVAVAPTPAPLIAPPLSAPLAVVVAPPAGSSLALPPIEPTYSTVSAPVGLVLAPVAPPPEALPARPTVTAPPPPTFVSAPAPAPAPVAPRLPIVEVTPAAPPAYQPVTTTVAPAPLPAVPDDMAAEIQPLVDDLFNALRPSVRERAALALTECRYGSRREVKAILARAALLDPAPPVRAYCIRRLSLLGYHESTYLAYLEACAESGHPTVQRAAADALAKLTSRN